MAATDAKPFPIKNTAYRVYFPILDADGDLVSGATGLDSEASLDGGTFADCTNEATEIATSSGIYYLDLTASEMNTDCTVIQVKTSSSGAKTTVLTLYPVDTGDIDVDVTAFGGTAGTFASGRPEVNATHWAGTAVASANVRADLRQIIGTTITEGASGRAAGSFSTMHNVASPVFTTASVNQTGDAYAQTTASAIRSAVGLSTANLDVQLATIDDYIDTEMAAVLAAVDTEVGAIKAVTDKLDTALELDVSVYRFTTNALENAPSGGGGGTDWTADERTAIKTILGVPASGTTPDAPTAGALKVIDDYIDTEVAAILAAVDTEIGTINTNLSALITTVGAAGAGLTALAPAATALSTATWTTARAGYLDALNGGIVVKRNTALANFEFLMVLSSDHVTGATGKTITATRSIDGGAFASCTNSASEVSNGVYKISLSAADLNGTTVTLRFTAASCDDTFITILTQP